MSRFLPLFLMVVSFLTVGKTHALVHHDLQVTIEPASNLIRIVDRLKDVKPESMAIPANARQVEITYGKQKLRFKSNKSGNYQQIKPFYPKIENKELQISYDYHTGSVSGVISAGIDAVVDEIGVYLSPASYWYPYIESEFETLSIQTILPNGWTSVTSGNEISNSKTDKHVQNWEISKPIDRVFLIANQFIKDEELYRGIKIQTYFHQDVSSFSSSYLMKLKEYLDTYLDYFGSYPYDKFAVISNFFSTGYGMPGFTLLDKNIIPYQFIVDTSLGHELLHNWWGNGVYVDWSKGNWCEGLTTFQADYFYEVKKGLNEARNYRLETLREYNNFVTSQNAFAVADFRSRFDKPSKAIGYGKVMMIFHMLEKKLGTMAFDIAVKELASIGMFKYNSWDDIEDVFSRSSGKNLGSFFDQWVKRTDIPEINYQVKNGILYLEQLNAIPYELNLPVRVVLDNGTELDFNLSFNDKNMEFEVGQDNIEKVLIDSDFDLMRVIYDFENPPTLNKIWSGEELDYYSNISTDLTPYLAGYPITPKSIDPFHSLNQISGKSFIFLSLVNSDFSANQLDKIEPGMLGFSLNSSEFTTGQTSYGLQDHVIVINFTYQKLDQVLVLAPSDESLLKVIPKLSHYGKYSALVFDLNGRKVLATSW